MATVTLGTAATTTLTALAWTQAAAIADVATIAAHIKDDQNAAHPVITSAFQRNGRLFVPNRGVLLMKPGDYVAYDDRGWPILVSSDSIANGSSWVHS